MTKKDIKRYYPRLVEPSDHNLVIAREAVNRLWHERSSELGVDPGQDRSGSCKFAALIARSLFGGRLCGNQEHVFVRNRDASVLDLNDDQQDVAELGGLAHEDVSFVLLHPDYVASLSSCVPRAARWADWALARMEELAA